ncbi:unnamed protein product (macronuclear) [Paramecium tetraurelia]|uniref:Rho-GAP domain-containing protein n=1 Tax=Paramecium tetraurelia TaxID=5888 RepID=A0EBM0_PARTE|nr:uncharacterized protein GSPATT00025421001 [Paramecium tetraurelia]CAK92687.1 unnamed protein product [Paramecium tetraurelia]|eukprot:XP_001460084.1 hypothetical protein (macronuclear) [Paramecium tetraurelia strain d4-2]
MCAFYLMVVCRTALITIRSCITQQTVQTIKQIRSIKSQYFISTYTIVYIMSQHDGLSQLIRFRKLMRQLPSKYYIQLKCFYIYQPSFKIKANLLIQRQRSRREKILYKKTKYIYEVKELLQIPNFQGSWMNTFPKQIQSFEQIEPVQLIKQSSSSFGSSLNSQKLNQFQIPVVIDHLLSYFVVNQDRFLIPDIFRKQGLITEEDQLQQQLINENYECLKIVEDVRIICSLIKRFFLELPDPLIPEHIYKWICEHIEQTTPQTEIDLLKEVFDQLPNLNKQLLIVMVNFLICVGNYSEFNRMNMNNLAILFAPCFMRVQVNQTQSIEQIKLQLKFLKILFDNYDKIFPNVSFKLYLQYCQTQIFSSISSNGSIGGETSGNKNQRLSSSEEDILPEFQQKQK